LCPLTLSCRQLSEALQVLPFKPLLKLPGRFVMISTSSHSDSALDNRYSDSVQAPDILYTVDSKLAACVKLCQNYFSCQYGPQCHLELKPVGIPLSVISELVQLPSCCGEPPQYCTIPCQRLIHTVVPKQFIYEMVQAVSQ